MDTARPAPARLASEIVALLLVAFLALLAWPCESVAQVPPGSRERALSLQTPAPSGRIVVKFHEESGLRVRADGVVAVPGVQGAGAAAARVGELLQRSATLLDLDRHFTRTFEEIEGERALAEARGGRDLPDLNTYARLSPRAAWTREGLLLVIEELLADPAVETAFLEPVAVPAALGFDAFTGSFDPEARGSSSRADVGDELGSAPAAGIRGHGGSSFDPAPATPDYTAQQGYLDPAPTGVGAESVWSIAGGRGATVKVIDIEGAWLWDHEDLPDPFFTAGGSIPDVGWRNHGTAVLGEIRGAVNAFGVTGIAADVQVGACSIAELSVADAINTAAAALDPGDIYLIELHAPGPNANGSGQYGYVCMEFWQDNFDAIQIASALGRICCQAAGNGEQDLDDPVYGGLFDRNVRDSGAILCGASDGSSLSPAWFTNHGDRVDLHGWGFSVVTTGYGDLQGGAETQWYTAFFSGTSSASPIVVGSVASLQGMAKANLGVTLDATLAREILVATGTPQSGSSRHIGPRPNLVAAWALADDGVGQVEGVVTEAGLGAPLEDVGVSVVGTGHTVTTNSAGEYALPLLTGNYTLAFSSPFFQDAELPVTIVAGGTADGDIALERRPTVTLTGSVRSTETGLPVAGVRAEPQVDWLPATSTGIDGSWSIPGVPVGLSYDIAFDRRPGFGAEYETVEVQDAAGGAFLAVDLAPAAVNFEANNGGFSANGLWTWGTPSSGGPNSGFSGTRCWGVGMIGDYPDNATGTLTSPVYDFSGETELELSFHFWSETENCFDGVNVEVFDGEAWNDVAPLAGYSCGWLGGLDYEDGWTGSTGGWVGAVFDLGAYIGPNVRFRLKFGSDGGVNGDGFWIDEIAFDTGSEVSNVDPLDTPGSFVPALSASPNPFTDRVELRLGAPITGAVAQVVVYDATGRSVRKLRIGEVEGSAWWDGRDDRGAVLPGGVYFARLLAADGRGSAASRLVFVR